MKAIHVNSTAPFFSDNSEREYYVEDFDILTTILSALMWRKLNGSIKLYTDNIGKKYYESLDLLYLWNRGVDTEVLESISAEVNQQIYWAAAKLFALRSEDAPVAILDTDLIVWESLHTTLYKKRLAVIHREHIDENIYLSKELLKTKKGYQFDPEWDWTELPCNSAFVCFSDDEFKNYYTECAIDFMTGKIEYPEEMVSQMVFAEQRLLAMCAKQKNAPIYHFLDNPFQERNSVFTHIWGAKSVARNDAKERYNLCIRLMQKIESVFPDDYSRISQIEKFKQYL